MLRTEFPAGAKAGAAKWIIRPAVSKDWRYAPVVQASQVGYHPAQKKVAVIELDKRDTGFKQPTLFRITAEGRQLVKQQEAKDWGDFLRYHYLQFDLSEVTDDGLYQVMYGDVASPVFGIAKDVWDNGIWQAEIEYFLPVQMCHVRVNEKYRVWHDFCHQNDARFNKAIRQALPQLQAMYQEYSAKTPYGVPHDKGNSSSGSWEPQHLGYNLWRQPCRLVVHPRRSSSGHEPDSPRPARITSLSLLVAGR